MGKSLKYVKNFDFSSAGKTVGYCGGGMTKKGYADGGKVRPAVSAMARKEIMATPTMQKREVVQKESVRAPAAPKEMLRDTSSLGIKNNKNPGIGRRRMPVAPNQPMISPYKKGGKVKYEDGGYVPPSENVFRERDGKYFHNNEEISRGDFNKRMEAVDRRMQQLRGPDRRGMSLRDRAKSAMSDLDTETKDSFEMIRKREQLPRERSKAVMRELDAVMGGEMAKGGAVAKAGAKKIPKVMREFKAGELHSGSKSGPVVKSRDQALAIALSEARKAGKKKS